MLVFIIREGRMAKMRLQEYVGTRRCFMIERLEPEGVDMGGGLAWTDGFGLLRGNRYGV